MGLSRIVTAATVAKGALHHPFEGKTDLFRAVLEEARTEVGEAVALAEEAHGDPWPRPTADGRMPGLPHHHDRTGRATDPAAGRSRRPGGTVRRAQAETASARRLTEVLTAPVDTGVLAPTGHAPGPSALGGHERGRAVADRKRRPHDLEDVWAALSLMLECLRAARPRE